MAPPDSLSLRLLIDRGARDEEKWCNVLKSVATELCARNTPHFLVTCDGACPELKCRVGSEVRHALLLMDDEEWAAPSSGTSASTLKRSARNTRNTVASELNLPDDLELHDFNALLQKTSSAGDAVGLLDSVSTSLVSRRGIIPVYRPPTVSSNVLISLRRDWLTEDVSEATVAAELRAKVPAEHAILFKATPHPQLRLIINSNSFRFDRSEENNRKAFKQLQSYMPSLKYKPQRDLPGCQFFSAEKHHDLPTSLPVCMEIFKAKGWRILHGVEEEEEEE